MTTETPCLPGCREYYLSPSIPTEHALGCPNAPKPAEPRRRVMIVGSGISAAMSAMMDEEAARKPAEPPAPPQDAEPVKRLHRHIGCGSCDRNELDYRDLKAERDALSVKVGRLRAAVAGEEARNADLDEATAALKARVEALTAAANRVVKRRNRHYKDVRDSVDTLEAVLAKTGNACSPKCGSYEHVVEDQHAEECPNLSKEQEATNGR